ncbi:MAG: hypothetical protein LBJ10_05045, partial [Clostridiales bacterium]|nr:hypothetical protein [Clostridiales bacterium]
MAAGAAQTGAARALIEYARVRRGHGSGAGMALAQVWRGHGVCAGMARAQAWRGRGFLHGGIGAKCAPGAIMATHWGGEERLWLES